MENTGRRLEPLVLFLMISLLGFSSAEGGSKVWTTSGPKGGDFSALAARDKVLFVASERGIYKSSDWGNRWNLSLEGGPSGFNGFVTSLTIDPADPSVVFATIDSSDGRPLFKSTDAGESWRAITAGLTIPNEYDGRIYRLQSLAIDPLDSRIIYAGTAEGGLGLSSGLVVKSLDGGESWQRASVHYLGRSVQDLKIDREDRRILYAVTATYSTHGALLSSADGGATWVVLNDGFPWKPLPGLTEMVIDPRDHSTLYLATQEHGVYRSHDAGATWREINDGLPPIQGYSIYPIVEALSWDADGALYAGLDPYGLFRSTDGGDHWTAINFGSAVTGISVGESDRSLILVVGPRGVYRSADGGDSWRDGAQGIVSSHVAALVTDPTMPGAVYAGTYTLYSAYDWDPGDGRWMPPDESRAGVYRSVDRGRTWARTSLPDGYVYGLTVDPRTGWIYASLSGGQLLKSEDHGIAWRALHWPLLASITAIAIDSEHSILYAATSGWGVYKSRDGGDSWYPVNNGLTIDGTQLVGDLVIDPTDTNVLFATAPNHGVYKTVDGGEAWTQVNEGLPHRDGAYVSIYSIRIDPSHPQVIYACTLGSAESRGVYRSDDGGLTWKGAGNGLLTSASRNVLDLLVDPRNSQSVYIATYDGVFHSDGEEIFWQPMNEGIANTWPSSFALDPHSPGTLYVGTSAGVFSLGPLRDTHQDRAEHSRGMTAGP